MDVYGKKPEENGSQLGFSFEEPKTPQRRVWKVSELTGQLRVEVERSFSDLWLEGEICDLRIAASGHLYFNIKDESAQISVVMFRRQAGLLRFRPEDGLHVLLRGKLSVYEQMEIAVGLVFYGLDDPGMAVAGIAYAYSADEVQIALAGAVVEVKPFRCYYLQSEGIGGGLGDVPEK